MPAQKNKKPKEAPSDAEKTDRVNKKKISRRINFTVLILAMALLFFSCSFTILPLWLAYILVLTPWAGIFIPFYSKNLPLTESTRNWITICPQFCLLFLPLSLHVDWQKLSIYAICIAVILGMTTYRICGLPKPDKRAAKKFATFNKILIIVFMVIMWVFYGFGAATLINASLDMAPTEIVRVPIAGMHISRGRRNTSYYLTLAPWQDSEAHPQRSERVSPTLYNSAHVGDHACLETHPGALGASWHNTALCAQDDADH